MELSEKIKRFRKENGFSQEELAERLAVSRQAITKWETGIGIPDVVNLKALAGLFGITVDELLSDTPTGCTDSVTEYDVDESKHFDVSIGCAAKITVRGAETEKIKVRLSSAVKHGIKVKIEEIKGKMDVSVRRTGSMTDAELKKELSIVVELPVKYLIGIELEAVCTELTLENLPTHIEYDGKADVVRLRGNNGHIELDVGVDMRIYADGLNADLDVNQLSCASVLRLPERTSFVATKKGLSNRLHFMKNGIAVDAPQPSENAPTVRLNGRNSELIVELTD